MAAEALMQTDIASMPVRRGKVRDIYDLGERLLIVATDRISAFDVIMPNGIPQKGIILTQLSRFWFERFSSTVNHHLISTDTSELPAAFRPFAEQLRGRIMLVRKAEPLKIECVVRGYLAGSGWKQYQQTGRICGIELPPHLRQCDRLPEPIFTPATKAETGHDINIDFDEACRIVGDEQLTCYVRQRSIEIYTAAADYARQRGIIIADTKFEWGLLGTEPVLIDELLTPDSSRFWPADRYQPGRDQESFDKQFVRNYLQSLSWDKTPPAPALPADIVAKTRQKYLQAYELLTGKPLELD